MGIPGALCVVVMTAASVGSVPPPPVRVTAPGGLSRSVWDLARVRGAARSRLAAQRRARFRKERLLVEVLARGDGISPAVLVDAVHRWAGEVDVVGVDRLDAWIPVDRLEALASEPAVGFVRLPLPVVPTTGQIEAEGVSLVGAPALHCVGVTGTGTLVAVVDSQFGALEATAAAGEIPGLIEIAGVGQGGSHGTACAEVISDMAPGAEILPVLASTFTALQYFVLGLPFDPVDVVSHSLLYLGTSFGDGDGPVCGLLQDARDLGVAWVTSAGNIRAGHLLGSVFEDADGDGWMEMPSGSEYLEIEGVTMASFSVNLDWDDYQDPTMDLDLYAYRWDGSGWEIVGSSTREQAFFEPPFEDITLGPTGLTQYAFRVFAHPGVEAGLPMRILLLGNAAPTLAEHGGPGASYDPAACLDTLAVGALEPDKWETGPPAPYSPRGPTTDGRVRPEIMAPGRATTASKPSFVGTSAAAPHVAGAVALYREASGGTALEAMAQVLEDAIPMGDGDPNNLYGHGRLRLDATRGGWACEDGQTTACATDCGSEGVAPCGSDCRFAECVPPEEICSGGDEDCDGQVDEGFDCTGLQQEVCETACGSQGIRACRGDCAWGPCGAPTEICDGADQDCDGAIDEDAGCSAPPEPGGCGGAPGGSTGPWVLALLMASTGLRPRAKRHFPPATR